MAKTSLIITSTDQLGKGLQKTVTDVNPDATSAQLVTFATKLNALTTNSYVRTDRVDKTNCDTEASGKQTPTLTLAQSTVTLIGSNKTDYINITYTGDGQLFVGDWSVDVPDIVAGFLTESGQLKIGVQQYPAAKPCTCTIMATETANYKAVSTTLTFVSA
ncbi:MAG: hypothetical protein IJQ82_14445 [Selenomonadaceae bacterium]|nr:hypothetical protein [Selenomonadaceae bacterium]